MTDIDEATGLPELPSNYRWKVKIVDSNPYEPWGHVDVTLQEKKTIWHNLTSLTWDLGEWVTENLTPYQKSLQKEEFTNYSGTVYYLYDPIEYPALIRRLAEKVLARHSVVIARDAFGEAVTEARKRISGTYPPKKLS